MKKFSLTVKCEKENSSRVETMSNDSIRNFTRQPIITIFTFFRNYAHLRSKKNVPTLSNEKRNFLKFLPLSLERIDSKILSGRSQDENFSRNGDSLMLSARQ